MEHDLDELTEQFLEVLPDPRHLLIWRTLHMISAAFFLALLYFTGPSWIGVAMAFVAGINLAQVWFYRYASQLNASQRAVHAALLGLNETVSRYEDASGISDTTETKR